MCPISHGIAVSAERIGSGGVAIAVPVPFLSPGRDASIGEGAVNPAAAAGQRTRKTGEVVASAAVLCCSWRASLEG